MGLFKQIEHMGHEQIVFCNDPVSGLKAIIAIHDTTLGPALGGTRLLPYATEEEALDDVLRLSRGMTYKAACAGLPLGGGKAVIIADPGQKSEVLFRAYGRFVESLAGRYITAEDMNTNVLNMDHVRLETKYVTGVSPALGGSGDPSILTALGTFHGILASVEYRLGKKDLRGVRIAVQGTGAVGRILCRLLHEQGALLFVQDIDDARIQEMKTLYHATPLTEQELYSADVDVYAPCARGATLNTDHIGRMKAKVVAGCANNQLENEGIHAKMLKDAKILYAPDYVINAGGLINVANELTGYNREKVEHEVTAIGNTLKSIFIESDRLGITTHEASMHFAEKRIKNVQNLKPLQTFDQSFLGKRSAH
jgi:leucine dehydrogenase